MTQHLTIEDAIHIARGCLNYKANYHERYMYIFREGVQAVIEALECAKRGNVSPRAGISKLKLEPWKDLRGHVSSVVLDKNTGYVRLILHASPDGTKCYVAGFGVFNNRELAERFTLYPSGESCGLWVEASDADCDS